MLKEKACFFQLDCLRKKTTNGVCVCVCVCVSVERAISRDVRCRKIEASQILRYCARSCKRLQYLQISTTQDHLTNLSIDTMDTIDTIDTIQIPQVYLQILSSKTSTKFGDFGSSPSDIPYPTVVVRPSLMGTSGSTSGRKAKSMYPH